MNLSAPQKLPMQILELKHGIEQAQHAEEGGAKSATSSGSFFKICFGRKLEGGK